MMRAAVVLGLAACAIACQPQQCAPGCTARDGKEYEMARDKMECRAGELVRLYPVTSCHAPLPGASVQVETPEVCSVRSTDEFQNAEMDCLADGVCEVSVRAEALISWCQCGEDVAQEVSLARDHGAVIAAGAGVIRDGFGGAYPQNGEWSVTIEGVDCELEWTSFDLEESRGCIWDYLEVTAGATVEKYCGSALPTKRLYEGTRSVTVKLHSDAYVVGAGFAVRYQCSACGSDNDCKKDEFCRVAAEDVSSPFPACVWNRKECVAKSGEGAECGGLAKPCWENRCVEGLTCKYDRDPSVSDLPGRCRAAAPVTPPPAPVQVKRCRGSASLAGGATGIMCEELKRSYDVAVSRVSLWAESPWWCEAPRLRFELGAMSRSWSVAEDQWVRTDVSVAIAAGDAMRVVLRNENPSVFGFSCSADVWVEVAFARV